MRQLGRHKCGPLLELLQIEYLARVLSAARKKSYPIDDHSRLRTITLIVETATKTRRLAGLASWNRHEPHGPGAQLPTSVIGTV